jgi:hypothetical protein
MAGGMGGMGMMGGLAQLLMGNQMMGRRPGANPVQMQPPTLTGGQIPGDYMNPGSQGGPGGGMRHHRPHPQQQGQQQQNDQNDPNNPNNQQQNPQQTTMDQTLQPDYSQSGDWGNFFYG